MADYKYIMLTALVRGDTNRGRGLNRYGEHLKKTLEQKKQLEINN